VVERNRIEAVAGAGVGITVATVAADAVSRAVDESVLRNNVVADLRLGIALSALRDDPAALGQGRVRTVLRHNTVLAMAGDGLLLSSPEADPAATEPAVWPELANNIVTGCGGFAVREDPGDQSAPYLAADASALVTNLFAANGAGGYFDLDSGSSYDSAAELDAIPDLAGASRGNLDLQPLLDPASGRPELASPGRDAGDPVLSAGDDFDRMPRPLGAGPDIGAFETVAIRRASFTDVDPPTPAKGDVFAAIVDYRVAPPTTFLDPEAGIVDDRDRPLVVYQLSAGLGARLEAVKDPATASVRLLY
jgi:hypothetical protein